MPGRSFRKPGNLNYRLNNNAAISTMKLKYAILLFSLILNWQACLAGPLHEAIMSNDTAEIKPLLKQKSAINEVNEKGMWPLLIATTYGFEDVVSLLIESGADVNQANSHGYTALHEAAGLGYYKITKLLLNKQANVHKRDISNYNALNYAQMSGSDKVIRLLKRRGAKE